MAHKKAGGSAKNLRDSNPKYLGTKLYSGETRYTDITVVDNEAGSLRDYARMNNIDYLLVETVGQRKMDTIKNRVKINLTIIKTTIKSLNLI